MYCFFQFIKNKITIHGSLGLRCAHALRGLQRRFRAAPSRSQRLQRHLKRPRHPPLARFRPPPPSLQPIPTPLYPANLLPHHTTRACACRLHQARPAEDRLGAGSRHAGAAPYGPLRRAACTAPASLPPRLAARRARVFRPCNTALCTLRWLPPWPAAGKGWSRTFTTTATHTPAPGHHD